MGWDEINSLTIDQFNFMISAYNEDMKEKNRQARKKR